MNPILQAKLNELENASEYECWYLVKQPTAFDCLCYLVSFLKEYKENKYSESLENYIGKRITELKLIKPEVEISNNYRALRVAAFFGLITMISSKYDEAIITEVFNEITTKCGKEYEKTDLYIDVIQRQIEKMYISSPIDEAYQGVRQNYRLYPVMLLYKVLLELGRATGKYSISITEYRYLVATTKEFEGFLETLLLIKLLRDDSDDTITKFEGYRTKFDNRLIQALKQLKTLSIDRQSISLMTDKIEEVAHKVFSFEQNPSIFDTDNYLGFLASNKSLFDLCKKSNKDIVFIQENILEKEDKKIDKPHQRIFFGAPGTGKSYSLNKEAKEYFSDRCERVTFHPDYSYANFVGTYKPAMEEEQIELDKENQEIISILTDKNKTSQEKYNELYDKFKEDDNITRLPILLTLYADDNFKTRKIDGTNTSEDNIVEKKHGKAIKPYVNLISSKAKKSNIVYKYVPGPFMRVYVNAIRSIKKGESKPYLLIIEEINRANVAAVFGDVFQLLDRSSQGDSEYPIQATEDMKQYLAKELGGVADDYTTIKIPSNMYIWATMNSADQGVMPIDTAFRRRWEFNYLGINESADNNKGDFEKYKFKINSTETVNWDEFRRELNRRLSSLNIPEDKLIGPYFISKTVLEETDLDKLTEIIKNKVLMYLYEDAAKAFRSSLFAEKQYSTYSTLCKNFDENALSLFKEKLEIKTEEINSISSVKDELSETNDLPMVAEDHFEYGK